MGSLPIVALALAYSVSYELKGLDFMFLIMR
jgi:hypothetical protein